MNRLNLISLSILLVTLAATLSSCEAIAGIFKAGIWTGVIVVVGIIGLVVYFVSRGRK